MAALLARVQLSPNPDGTQPQVSLTNLQNLQDGAESLERLFGGKRVNGGENTTTAGS